MRQIFLSLVGVNLLILMWGLFLTGGASDSASASGVRSSNLGSGEGSELRDSLGQDRVVSELNAGGELPDFGKVKPNQAALQPLCEIVGPFPNSLEASNFMERLSAIDITSTEHQLELSVGSNYWVYLAPATTRKEARRVLKDLQSRGVDSYVVPKGEYANAISLGMFTKKDLANGVVRKLVDKGFDPNLKVIDRTQIEIWVMVSPADAEKMSDLTWERVMKEIKSQERRENFCLDVASEQNIQ